MSLNPLLFAGAVLVCCSGPAFAQETGKAAPEASENPTVTVNGRKKPVTKKLGKTIYNAADNPKTESGTAQDVLQSTPTVSVSPNGDLSVKGNANVTVLINGKPSAEMSGENRAVALQTMNGSDIASVEVITNPSAAYAANGGAIVNIVLKKSRKPGAHGSMRGNISDQGLWNVGGSGDYSRGKLSLHGSAGVRRDGTLKFRQSDVDWHDLSSGAFGQNQQSSQVFIRRWTSNASLGLDYDLDDKNSVSASVSYNFRRSRPFFDEFHRDFAAGLPANAYHRVSHGPNQQSDDSLNLGYTHQDNETVLKALVQHSDTISLTDKSFVTTFAYPLQSPSYARIANKAGRHLDQATLDYARPLGTAGQLGIGLDFQHDTNAIDAYFADLDPATGIETVDLSTTHRYRVVESRKAAYVTAQKTWAEKWEVLLGLRYEAVATRIEAGSTIRGADYRSLNPSLHLKSIISADKSLSLSYRQSLQRPDPRDLDPFLTYGDAQNLSTGNPGLKPQPVKSLELSYDIERTKLSRSLGIFYRRSRETVIDSRSFTAGNILLTTKQNAGSGLATGVSGSVDWRPADAFHLSVDANLYYVELTTIDLGVPVKQSSVSGGANFSLSYSAGANDLSVDAHIRGTGITPQGTQSATSALNVTWKRRLTGRLNLSVMANDVFDGAKQGYTTTTSTFSQRGYNHFVARRVYIGLVYKIG